MSCKIHPIALKDLWQNLGKLPEPLADWERAICSEAKEVLEPLPVLNPSTCPHTNGAEAALVEALPHQQSAAPESILINWRQRQPRGNKPAIGGYGAIQKHLGAATDQVGPDPTVSCFELRDPRKESQFASALAQRMLDDGLVDALGEIEFLAPDDLAYMLALQESCEQLGLP